ncbi:MAG: tetratricopeptide repeat protein [Candidatus Peregrinibacteria bacterium]
MPDTYILLEEETPYDRSLKWKIHSRYFQERGNKAWLKGEVPYQITCNSAAARQNAALVHRAALRMEEEGTLSPTDPIAVIEIACGLGLFAINFIRCFRDVDAEAGTRLADRLHYECTDFSEENIHDAACNPALGALAEEGILHFALLDATRPQTMRLFPDGETVPLPPLTATIGNYVHCCLPTSVIRKTGDTLEEKHVRLSLKVPESLENKQDYAERYVKHPVGETITENLNEEIHWHDLREGFFSDPLHEEVVREGAKDFPVATILYPRGSFANIQGTLPSLLPGGILLITDKGYADASYMEGERACEPSIHGNSFAHSLNFPLLALLAEKLGCSVTQTTDPNLSVQTLLIEKRKSETLADLFTSLFVTHNDNVLGSDLYAAGRKFEEVSDHRTAIRFYERALMLRPYDTWLSYRLGHCLCENGEYGRAAQAWMKGQTFDHFREYDFDFWIAYALHKNGSYAEALPFYQRSGEREQSATTSYNIGLCQKALGNPAEAEQAFAHSLELNPQYEKARDALRDLRREQEKQNAENGGTFFTRLQSALHLAS